MKLLNIKIGKISIFLLIIGLFACHSKKSKEKPNFVILLVDDLGEKDVGCYGNDFIETPNIDKLAEEGMKWTNAYSSCPVCSPTRVALLTGKNPARVNFTGHIPAVIEHRYPEHGRIIPPKNLMHIPKEEVILPEAIKPAGYKSISIGKWHVGHKGYWPTDMGFDENVGGWTHGSPPTYYYPYENPDKTWNSSIPTLNVEEGKKGQYLTDRLTDEAINFIEENRNTPFLVYLTYYAVHKPLEAPKGKSLVKKYKQKQAETDNNRLDPVYAAMIDNLDWNIGKVLQTLNDLGLEENTVVIFASDNGAVEEIADLRPYRAGKGYLYEGGIRVPYIMKWPGHINPGTISDVPTKTEDIYATVVDIVGEDSKPNQPIDGRSLVSDFTEGVKQNNEVNMYWYFPHYVRNQPGAAIISGQYKFIEFYDPDKFELYNLDKDAGETNDLSDSEELRWKVKELQGKLRKWLHDVDPIMHTMNPNDKK